jgi:hypothetical protein
MPVSLVAVALSTQLIAANAGQVPTLNMHPTCESPMRGELGAKSDLSVCLEGEQRARDELVKNWSEFTRGERAECSDLVHMGGPPSYIELLTCLEMAREVRSLHARPAQQQQKTP